MFNWTAGDLQVEKFWLSCQVAYVHNFDLHMQSTVLLRELLKIVKVEGS